jgi:hypothetical protein
MPISGITQPVRRANFKAVIVAFHRDSWAVFSGA